MAIIEDNPWIEGARGTVRNAIVYRQRGGKTIISAKPAKSTKPRTEKQKAHTSKFIAGNGYSNRVKKDEVLLEIYRSKEEGLLNWQNLAIQDYHSAPVVEDVLARKFTGKTGEAIEVYAYDDFTIASLKVTVFDNGGRVLAKGEAEAVADNEKYAYILNTDLPTENGVNITVEARDLPGNVTVFEKVLAEGRGV